MGRPLLSETGEHRLIELTIRYTEELSANVKLLANLLGQEEWVQMQRLAHRVANASLYGMNEISEVALQLEVLARARKTGKCWKTLRELELEVSKAQSLLSSL